MDKDKDKQAKIIEKLVEQYNNLKKEKDTLQQNYDKIQKESTKSLIKEQSSKKDQISENQKLQNQVKELKIKLKKYENQIHNKENITKDLQKRLNDKNNIDEKSKAKYTQIFQKFLGRKPISTNSTDEKLITLVNFYENQKDKLERENDNLFQTNEEYRNQINELQQLCQNDDSTKDGEIFKLQAFQKDLVNRAQQLDIEKSQYIHQNQELQRTTFQQQSQIQELQKKLSNLQNLYDKKSQEFLQRLRTEDVKDPNNLFFDYSKPNQNSEYENNQNNQNNQNIYSNQNQNQNQNEQNQNQQNQQQQQEQFNHKQHKRQQSDSIFSKLDMSSMQFDGLNSHLFDQNGQLQYQNISDLGSFKKDIFLSDDEDDLDIEDSRQLQISQETLQQQNQKNENKNSQFKMLSLEEQRTLKKNQKHQEENKDQILNQLKEIYNIQDLSMIIPCAQKMQQVILAIPRLENLIKQVYQIVLQEKQQEQENQQNKPIEILVPTLQFWRNQMEEFNQMKKLIVNLIKNEGGFKIQMDKFDVDQTNYILNGIVQKKMDLCEENQKLQKIVKYQNLDHVLEVMEILGDDLQAQITVKQKMKEIFEQMKAINKFVQLCVRILDIDNQKLENQNSQLENSTEQVLQYIIKVLENMKMSQYNDGELILKVQKLLKVENIVSFFTCKLFKKGMISPRIELGPCEPQSQILTT
ncbi:hypothetical protein PPERSA_12456 [Pseudocohnilembus persalinus]|uniref:Centrosomal protein of 70 kDa n=1 Tax=Pseudocohnilembus persalinus TaxID=266149 RepID=A0A0V0QNX9_PSEPJ|nr:hypothetical protein PPERSA_12456 [Pseudocohnilembus persalinus]|eukprot:KRX04009.1 hypothetical protein PPERSA_12456 [Pseudocohnilembus persalinus]